jgi:hypothetical protein
VYRRLVLTCLAGTVVACSSPALPERAAADTLSIEAGIGSAAFEGDLREDGHPTVLFRCDAGKVGAYIVPGTFDSLPSEDQLVPITLDSAPAC